MKTSSIILTFIIAGLFEIIGGYMIWIYMKEGKSILYGILGFLLLGSYGIIATFQTLPFGRVYIIYGGIFIVLSLLWSMIVDQFKLDKLDIIGLLFLFIGIFVISSPRTH